MIRYKFQSLECLVRDTPGGTEIMIRYKFQSLECLVRDTPGGQR